MDNRPHTQRILARARPLEPVPTGLPPDIRPLPGIRAALFDIYGTLVISASGDISLAQEQNHETALREAFSAAGLHLKGDSTPLAPGLHDAILSAQEARRREGVEFPEVEIREVWDSVLIYLRDAGALSEMLFSPEQRDTLALEYECRANPVWPMPGLRGILADLRGRGLVLGIVSNAQFYTPLMMEAFLGAPLADLGFDPDLCVYSFAEREGKPSARLYEKLAARLQARGIAPQECLYTGNDQRNDIRPAHDTGFHTALFAGDKRSLRLRKDDPSSSTVRPDRVLTELAQLRDLLS